MRLLNRIRHQPENTATPATSPEEVSCLHTALAPRWDTLSDMGDEQKVSAWVCASCGGTFTPERERELRASEAERVRQAIQTN